MSDRATETVSLQPEPSLPPPLAAGTLLAGRYRLGAVLGAGGYGVVYRAVDETTGASLAVKALRAERLSAAGRQRLAREASLLAGLENPHLVRVLEAGESEGVAYLTMELVDGEPLRERLLREVLPVAEAVRIAREMLAGLAALHGRGIVHRDVKPGNVLLDGEGRAKLADFGLVRRFDADATRATSSLAVLGTAEYLSPEQALGEDLDGRSDLYSLGVVLFEMLAGRPVHERRSTFATVLARLHEPAPDLRELRPEVPGWLAAVVGRLLEKEPGLRYASAEEALADLEGERVPRAVLRRKLLRRGALLTMVSLCVAAAIAGWAWTRWRGGFDHMATIGDYSVVALDRVGRELWRREDVMPGENFLPVHLRPGGPLRLAALLDRPGQHDPEVRRRLLFLDPQSGRVDEELVLPDGASYFPELSNRYGTRLRTVDLDGDGVDEILATSLHAGTWPSFTHLYEPSLHRARVLFLGGGHYYPAATADVDGDGRPEVLFLGTANRMGWYMGLAAVRVAPWVGEPTAPTLELSKAASPDESRVSGTAGLVWYTLLPRGFAANTRTSLEVVDGRQELRVHYMDGRILEVDFAGFRRDGPSPAVPPLERQKQRTAAYALLRSARGLEAGGDPAAAREHAEQARHLAERAGDVLLAEWSERVELRLAVAVGEGPAIEPRAEILRARADAPAELAYDLARAFHLRGDLARAVVWYERGLGRGSEVNIGRKSWEFLEGASLALAEQERWTDLVSFAASIGGGIAAEKPFSDFLVAWGELHRGHAPRRGDVVFLAGDLSGSPDLFRWLAFELRLALGDDPRAVLEAVARDRQIASDTVFALFATEAAALARLERWEEARHAAREAVSLAESSRERSVYARSLLGELRARASQIDRDAAKASR